ncbi:hypothetical protein [Candidatus Thiosymbion oneisti]|uniref:hypothetical protein n=1 Tax=Candidatus Thiosymbion oneisti TaxID=589554 RepID=UPI00105E1690|nr:hypothetical protein [Candidatus Thiosymbion oneisti]
MAVLKAREINIKFSAVKAAVLLLMLSSSTLSNSVENFGSEEFDLWNKIVTKDLFRSVVGSGKFSATLEDGKIIYVFVYQPPASDPGYILSAAVEIGPAGTFLNRAEYERSLVTTPLSERAGRFPSVGARAQTTAPFFGPGGSSFGLLSTTNDECFDLNVNVMQSGVEGNVATFDVLEISSRLHQAYDSLASITEK